MDMAERIIIDGELPIYSPVCHMCLNLTDGYSKKCKAFPKGIPEEIWLGEDKHLEKYPGQENDFLFSKISY